jgi:hypothetical protein
LNKKTDVEMADRAAMISKAPTTMAMIAKFESFSGWGKGEVGNKRLPKQKIQGINALMVLTCFYKWQRFEP